MKRTVILPVAAVLALAACGSSGGGSHASSHSSTQSPSGSGAASSSGAGADLSGSITVDAAASLTEAFTTLKQKFEAAHPGTTITLSFGASSTLATQITQGAPVDVFASASTKNMTQIGKTALDPVNFVSNTAEIATPTSNPAHITDVQDLARSGVKVAVCAAAVPCGVVASKVFANAKVTVKPVAEEQDVKSTLAAVESGEVDAGIVYVTDVRSAGDKVHGVTIPSDVNASTEYPISTLSGSKNSALAKAFVAYVLSADGKAVLTADGFSQP